MQFFARSLKREILHMSWNFQAPARNFAGGKAFVHVPGKLNLFSRIPPGE